jgi:4-amino-4-deoxy-L-arabinose transferase-like glycosyltransferase
MTAAICTGLGFLTKGAVAVILPGAIIFIWLLWERRLAALRTWSILWAAILFIILLTPVLLLLEKYNPGFFHYFVIDEHFSRFTGTRQIQLHPEPFWFFFQVLPLLMLPWTLFILRAVRQMVLNKFWHTDELSRFLVVWVVVVIGFFSASTGKLMSYIMPAIPPLALLLGRWGIAEPLDGSRRDRISWNIGAAGLLIVSLAIFIGWLTAYYQWLPKNVYPVRGISIVALIPVGLALLLIPARHLWQKPEGVLLGNAGILLAVAFLLSPLAGKDFNVFLRFNSSYVYKKLGKILRPEDQVIVFWDYRPALPFYLQRLYVPYEETNELLYGMQAEPQRARDLQDKAQLDEFMKHAPGRVFAVIEPHNIESKFKSLVQRTASVDIPHDPDTIVLEILPPLLTR